MKKIKKLPIVLSIIAFLIIVSAGLGIYFYPKIEGCWVFDDSRKQHLVFYDGKVYREGGVPNCLGVYKKGEFGLVGKYIKDNRGYCVEGEGTQIRVFPSLFELRLEFNSSEPPIIMKRDWDWTFHSETMKYIKNKSSNKKDLGDSVPPPQIYERCLLKELTFRTIKSTIYNTKFNLEGVI